MNRIACVPVVLIVALVAVDCARNPADSVPAAEVSEGSAAAGAQEEGSAEEAAAEVAEEGSAEAEEAVVRTVALSPESGFVGFVGSKVTAAHPGGWEDFSGTITVPGDDIEAGSVQLTLQMATIYADRDRLTEHLRSDDFFDVPNHPTATFESTSIVAGSAPDTFDVTGTLTIKETANTVTFPATITIVEGVVSAEAEFAINRQDWGISYPGMPDDLIRDNVVIKFRLSGELS